MKKCRVPDCDKPKKKTRALCSMHANRWDRHKSLDKPEPISQAGEKNHNWRGDSVSYYGVHLRLKQRRGVASNFQCACGSNAKHWSYTHDCPRELLSEKGFPYSTDLTRYVPRCVSCHKKYDLGIK